MNPQTTFLAFCIPARTALAFVPVFLDTAYFTYLGAVLLTIGLGFQYLYWTNSRLTAPEAGGVVWWHNLRVVHGMNFIFAGLLALHGKREAWIPLMIDVVLGLVAHLDRYS